MLDLDRLLHVAVDERASDVHIKVGARPYLRVDGTLVVAPLEIVEASDTETIAGRVLPGEHVAGDDAEGVYAVPGVGRFRVNAFRQRGHVGLVLRRIVPGVPGIDALALPPASATLAASERGLVLVTGLAGSGRTSTVAAMVDHVNERQTRHIMTVEKPIEVLHADKLSIVNQREVGVDTPSFHTALSRSLRRDPDVLMAGALPDADSVLCALEAADSGRLVIAVGLAVGAVDAITRLIAQFPPDRQASARTLLARTLRGVLCQRLVPRAGGRGRVPAVEVLVSSPPVVESVADPNGAGKLEALLSEGEFWGMQTFDQSLAGLYRRGMIDRDAALANATFEPGLRVTLEMADRERAMAPASAPPA